MGDLSKLRFSMEVDILDVEYEAARQQGKRETTEKLYAYIEGRHGVTQENASCWKRWRQMICCGNITS